ncbi:Esterase/lipase/thioesterase [Marasmius tenuissimus]|uniref:AA9 family lytic polysaccharide monooxygenase n=1 Tax=Marasmius tenuissimus TaxID=585030 RepID=A0ABR2ZSS7_9AGAR
MLFNLLGLALISLPKVLAHGGVLSIGIGGTIYDGWHPYDSPSNQSSIIRPWSSNPITDAGDATLACNDDGTSPASQKTATIAAGSKITAYWNQVWPHAQGPMLAYMASCGGSSCNGFNAKSAKWFKIDQVGLISGTVGNGYWGSGQMIDNNSSWTTTIPSTIPAGSYLIRFETIALHSMPAQFYPECAQLQVTGGGSQAPPSSILVSLPGAYSNSDPGVNINLYTTEAMSQTTYIIPGPAVYGSSGSSNPPSNPPATTTGGSSGTTAAPPPTNTGSAGTVAEYGQCGGTGWTGPTGCVSPYKCTVINPYYSQCL